MDLAFDTRSFIFGPLDRAEEFEHGIKMRAGLQLFANYFDGVSSFKKKLINKLNYSFVIVSVV